MRRLGLGNIQADARRLRPLMFQTGIRTTSALDYWDQLTCLHFGHRDRPITDHFRGTAIDNPWTWAGAPFDTPDQIEVGDSLLRVNCDAGERAFLYYDYADVPTGCKLASVALGLSSDVAGIFCGLRLDDGSDDNYVELTLYLSSTTPDQWIVRRRYRTGGGGVGTNDGDTMSIPTAMVLHMHLTGTKWSSWDIVSLLHTPFGITGTMYKQGSSRTATFTPTRCGLIFDNAADQSNTNWMAVDWCDLNTDDEWLTTTP